MNISSAPACSLPRPLRQLTLGTAFFLTLFLCTPIGTAYAQDGTPDPSFGTGGSTTTDFGANEYNTGMVLQPDGKIVLVGYTGDLIAAGNNDFAVARYNTDGSLDTSFDGDGKVTTDFDSNKDNAYAVALQTDGKIIVAGESNVSGWNTFSLARYNSNGSLDTSFNGDGKVSIDVDELTSDLLNTHESGRAVALQSDGKILVAGTGYSPANGQVFVVVRYNTDGTIDSNFGTNGVATTYFGESQNVPHAIVVQADGKIVVAGYGLSGGASGVVALARFDTDGVLDTTFDTDGKVTTDVSSSNRDAAYAVALQHDGKIGVAGKDLGTTTGHVFMLARYNTDGSLDTSFDGDGIAKTSFGGANSIAYALEVQADGKIVAVGTDDHGTGGYDIAVVRYNTDGSLDTGFDNDGMAKLDFAGGGDYGSGVAVQPDGLLVVSGYVASGGASKVDFGVMRWINTVGTCDTAEWSVVLAAGDYPHATVGETHRDDGNTAGMAACATDGLDSDLDAPEPGAPNGSYVQLYLDGPASDPVFGNRYTRQHVATEDLTSAYYDFTLGVGASGYSGQTLALEASDLSGFPAGYDLVILDAAVDGAGTNPLAHDLRGGPYSFTYGGARALTLRVGALPAPTVTLGDGGDLSGGDGEVPSTEPLDIPWSATGTKKLKIQYSTDGGSKNWHDILPETEDLNVINGGTTSWTPPEDTYGKSVLIRVTTTNAVGGETSQTSSAFMVPYPAPVISITGLESSGDASFDDISAFVGEPAAVRVQAEYAASATLAFSSDGGATFTDIDTWPNPSAPDLTNDVQVDFTWAPAVGDITYDGLLRLTAGNGEGLTTIVTSSRTQVLPKSMDFALAAGFQMQSLPLSAGAQTASEVFVDDGSGEAVSPLFLYSYAPASFYTLFDNIATTFTTGAGFWAGAGAAASGSFTATPLEGDASLALGVAGSYMLGVPYVLAISTEELSFTLDAETKTYDEALTANWIAAGLYTWDGGTYADAAAGALDPWKSYWLPAAVADLTVGFTPPLTPSASKDAESASTPQWALVVRAEHAGGQKDLTTALGVHSEAQMGYDRFDVPEPPVAPVVGPVRTFAERSAWGAAFAEYDREVQPPFAADEERAWSLVVEAPAGAVLLTWQMGAAANAGAEAPLVEGMTFELIDAVAGVRQALTEGGSYSFESDGAAHTLTVAVRASPVTSTDVKDEVGVPSEFALESNYPNPFNPETQIGFTLPQSSEVRLSVYDMLGREVAVLVEGVVAAGRHTVSFEAADLPSGTYLYRLEAGSFVETRRMVLVK